MARSFGPNWTTALATFSLVLLTACETLTYGHQLSDGERKALDDNAAMTVTCTGEKDCELKWARALDWVQNNSRWKLRNVNSTIITTEGPLDSTDAAFEVTKFPLGDDTYEIRFRAACGNIFGCVPSAKQLTADFKMYATYGP